MSKIIDRLHAFIDGRPRTSRSTKTKHHAAPVTPDAKRTTGQETHRSPERTVKASKAEEARARAAFRPLVREADKQLSKLISALVSGRVADAPQTSEKLAKVWDPLIHRSKLKSPTISELCGARLANPKSPLSTMSDSKLAKLDEVLSGLNPTYPGAADGLSGDPVMYQLKYSVDAELLRREMDKIDLGGTVPSGGGKRSLNELPLRVLDALHTRAKELLTRIPPQAEPDLEAELPGTKFKVAELQQILSATSDARVSLVNAQATVQALAKTVPSNPIAKRPIELIKLKEAVERLISLRKDKPSAELLRLQRELDRHIPNEKNFMEILIGGPVEKFDAREWTDEKIVELQQKVAGLDASQPATGAIQKAIQDNIDLRKLQARNNVDSVLRAALRSGDQDAALDKLLQAAAKVHEAAALFNRLDEDLGQKDLARWIGDTLDREVLRDPGALDRFKRFQANLNNGEGKVLRDVLSIPNKISRVVVASDFLETLSSCLDEMLPDGAAPAPQKKGVPDLTPAAVAALARHLNVVAQRVTSPFDLPFRTLAARSAQPQADLADATESESELENAEDMGRARADLALALQQKSVNGSDTLQLRKLLYQMSMVLDGTDDLRELNSLKALTHLLKEADILDDEVAADVLEFSNLLDSELAKFPTA